MDRLEWLKWRRQGIGASEAAILHNESPYKNRYDLFLEKTSLEDPKENGNFITDKGQALEPLIRKRWSTIAALDLGIESEWPPHNVGGDHKVMRASLDGLASEGDGEIVVAEFKYQGKEAHLKVSDGIIAEHYKIQVQHQLLVSGATKAYLVSYNDTIDTINYMEVLPDVEFHNLHIKKCREFWKEVLAREPSEETLIFKKEIKKEENKSIVEIALRYKEISDQIKALEIDQKTLKELLIKSNGTSDKTDFEYVTVTKASRAGSVDYSKIEALKGIDLEPYRGKSTEYFLVKLKS